MEVKEVLDFSRPWACPAFMKIMLKQFCYLVQTNHAWE